MTITNKYPGPCASCGAHVARKAGYAVKRAGRWELLHIACAKNKSKEPAVHSITFDSGYTITRNARGTCEDAPCCGCCTF